MSGVLLRTGGRTATAAVPVLDVSAFRAAVCGAVAEGARLALLCATDREGGGAQVLALLARDARGTLEAVAMDLPANGLRYSSLTPDVPAAHLFERELLERHGIVPEGHPWPVPVRGEAGPSGQGTLAPERGPFYAVEGEEVHEVAVGPVHAGIIEPGHFRFECHGEDVLHLEIRLGYQHRGAVRLLESAATASPRWSVLCESLAGDSVVAHTLAATEALEALCGVFAPPRAAVLRSVALEIERLSNHVGDLGALAGDVAYLPGAAWLGALRGEFLNQLMSWTGNRYGRGLVIPGGVRFDLDEAARSALEKRVRTAGEQAKRLATLLFGTASAVGRFESTGAVSSEEAKRLGLVGVAARASGLPLDVRADHPAGAYRFAHVSPAIGDGGDVYARAFVRRLEIDASVAFILDQLSALPSGLVRAEVPPPPPSSLAVGLVEGWRGEVLHCLSTDERGKICRHAVKDPSFHNWSGLSEALRGGAISDFPLINKSFNLSYAGHDL